MTALIRKEVRLLLPSWIVCLVAGIAPVWLFKGLEMESVRMIIIGGFSFGAVFIGLSSIGQEASLGTFSSLLSQPCSRQSLWRLKTGLAAMAIFTALLAMCFSWGIRIHGISQAFRIHGLLWSQEQRWTVTGMFRLGGLLAVVGLSGGFWTTLLLRQTMAAFWLTLVAPLSICVLLALLTGHYNTEPAVVVLVIYSIAGFLWARRQFLQAQDLEWTGGNVSLPAWRGWEKIFRSPPGKSSPVAALVRKELQMQQVAWVLVGGTLLLHFVAIVREMAGASGPTDTTSATLGVLLTILWNIVIPFAVGCGAVVEEHKLKTMESSFCLPVTRGWQFTIKFGCVMILALLLGSAVPWVLGKMVDLPVLNSTLHPLAVAGIAVTAFYASTLARGTLQALAASGMLYMGAGLALYGVRVWEMLFVNFISPETAFLNNGRLDNEIHFWGRGATLFGWVIGPAAAMTVLWLGYGNYKRLYISWRDWVSNFLKLSVVVGLAFFAALAIYARVWENWMELEPKHGPQKISAAEKVRICCSHLACYVLLPDGRIWSTFFLNPTTPTGEFRRAPTPGHFLDATNWTALTIMSDTAIGIQSDGSLWSLTQPYLSPKSAARQPKISRLGKDFDWTAVAANVWGGGVALKQDGTLWGISAQDPSSLQRFDEATDWAGLLPSNTSITAIKHDGSMWSWGPTPVGSLSDSSRQQLHVPDTNWISGPIVVLTNKWLQLHAPDTNWISVERMDVNQFTTFEAIHADGSFWRSALEPGNTFPLFDTPIGSNTLGRISKNHTVYRQMITGRAESSQSAGLEKNGTMWMYPNGVRNDNWHPSKYADWIVLGSLDHAVVSLAADGTLACWKNYRDNAQRPAGLLSPSRRPADFTFNIFE